MAKKQKETETQLQTQQIPKKKGTLLKYFKRNWMLYVMLIPGITYIVIFKYVPMYGLSLAFRDYNGIGKITDAAWVGFANFRRLFSTNAFRRALRNNIIISLQKLLWGFPTPIILALLIDGIRSNFGKRFVQTAVILPNFISWIVVYGLLYALFSPSSGAIAGLASLLGYEGRIPDLLSQKETFRAVIVGSHVWKNAGYGSIVYIAAIAGIDQELYEAAAIDGAGRWQQMWHVTLPGIRTTIVTLLIFRVGDVMYAGFDQIYAISNDAVISVADIIDTYVYRIGLVNANFSLATAAGFFQSLTGLILVLIVNGVAEKLDPDSAII